VNAQGGEDVELGMAVISLERMLDEEKDHAGTLEIRDDKDKKLVGTLTCEVTALRALEQIDDEDAAAAAAAAAPPKATGALARVDEVPTGYRLSERLPPASVTDAAASYPGRRPRAESIARADAFRAQPHHHRASITTGPFSRGQGDAPATTRGAYGSGVGVGGVEVAPEFEFEPAEAEEPALAERLRHERAQLAELAQEVIALSGRLKRPEAVPGLVTAREQAQRDPPPSSLAGPNPGGVLPKQERAPGGSGRLGTPSKRPAH